MTFVYHEIKGSPTLSNTVSKATMILQNRQKMRCLDTVINLKQIKSQDDHSIRTGITNQ